MRRLARLSLRARLAIAMVCVAVLTVAIATLFANRGLEPLVREAAQARLQRSAEHMAEIAAAVYAEENGWTPQARETLGHLAELDGLRIAIHGRGANFGSDLSGEEETRQATFAVQGREHCVRDAIASGHEGDAAKKTAELLEAVQRFVRTH